MRTNFDFLKLINFEIQIGIFTDLTSTLLKGDLHETSNTSREVQDILGEFSVGPSGAPALPPKQNANSSSTNANASNTSSSSLNRPSSVQVNFSKNPVLKKKIHFVIWTINVRTRVKQYRISIWAYLDPKCIHSLRPKWTYLIFMIHQHYHVQKCFLIFFITMKMK